MKQIVDCLQRAKENKPPYRKKWKATIKDNVLVLVHYHHLILVYDLNQDKVLFSNHDLPTDKRGHDDALRLIQEGFFTKEEV